MPRPVPPVLPRVVLGLLVVALLGLAAPGAQASFLAEAEDPAGDATSPDPGLDIIAVGLGYDRTAGRLAGGVALRGEPGEAPATIALVAATRSATGCDQGPAIGFGSMLDSSSAAWARVRTASEVTARGAAEKRGYRDEVQQFSVTDRQLAGLRPNCVHATLVHPDDPSIVYDTAGPIELVPQPSLSLRLGGLPKTVRSGRTYRLKVKVSNPGDAPTGRVRLTLARARGLTAKPKRVTLRSIGAGHGRTATIAVRLSARAETGTDLEVRAVAGKLDLKAETLVYVRKPTRPSGGGGAGGGGGTPSVCTQWFPDFSGESGGFLGLVPCVK